MSKIKCPDCGANMLYNDSLNLDENTHDWYKCPECQFYADNETLAEYWQQPIPLLTADEREEARPDGL